MTGTPSPGYIPVVGACDGLREPPQIEHPPVVYPRHAPPAPPVQHGDRLPLRRLPDLHGLRRVKRPDGLPRRGVHGDTCRARISGAGCQGATSSTLYSAWTPPSLSRSRRSVSAILRSRSLRGPPKIPIWVPCSPVGLDRVTATSSTGVSGGADSNLLRTASDALSHVPAGSLKEMLLSQDGHPVASHRRETLPAYLPLISGLA